MVSVKKIIFALLSISLVVAACTKDESTQPTHLYDGYITFINSTNQVIVLEGMTQHRGTQNASLGLNRSVTAYGGRSDIENLIDGGLVFPGGDYVTIKFRSVDYLPYEPETPRFERTVIMTINGPQNIRVKGQDGQYVIGGD